jgi:hypothetical protein
VTIVLEDFFNDLRRKAGIGDNPESRRSFMRALLTTLGEVNPRWGTSYAPDDEDDVSGSIEIEGYEYAAIEAGMRYYLQQAGAWSMDTDGEAWNKFDMHTRRAIGAAIAADTDFRTRTSLQAT